MTLPRLTVITPSLNQAKYLERTLRSVLDQDYPDLEYIVMDGGSTDGSVDILNRYHDRLAHWVNQPDLGQSWAINRAIERFVESQVRSWRGNVEEITPLPRPTV